MSCCLSAVLLAMGREMKAYLHLSRGGDGGAAIALRDWLLGQFDDLGRLMGRLAGALTVRPAGVSGGQPL